MTAAIQARELFHLYRAAHGDVAALRGLSLEVSAGEVVSVLGPSGSGKSTLLELCAGRLRPSSGELSVLGTDAGASARTLSTLRRNSIGIVRQHYHRSLPPELTVEETISLPLRLLGRLDKNGRAHVKRLIREAGLAERAHAKPSELSGGEQQRVAVCAALAKTPQLVIADEPTGELDARSTAVVVELLLSLAAEAGAAALIVTHDPTVALATERTIHIRDGRLAAEGATRPVLIVDEQGWLRIPQRLREEAGVRDRVRAHASWGRIELVVDDAGSPATSDQTEERLAPGEKRYATEVAFDRVSKRYGPHERPVVEELTWTFDPEQLHVLAGPSGSGKTTLLNLIAALERPDRGEVWVGGERIDGLSSNDSARWRGRTVGYLSQHSTLVDFLSAQENVELALTMRGFSRADATQRAVRWLEWVGLSKHSERRADRLSGGEQRRVALARALAPGPRVLIADEPTAHLDRVTGRMIVKLLESAAREGGATVIASSHDPDVISVADTKLTLGSHQERRAPRQRPSSPVQRRRDTLEEPDVYDS